jgi:hypothetical protein
MRERRKTTRRKNLSFIRRIALDILRAHPDQRSPARKMKLASSISDPFSRQLKTRPRDMP